MASQEILLKSIMDPTVLPGVHRNTRSALFNHFAQPPSAKGTYTLTVFDIVTRTDDELLQAPRFRKGGLARLKEELAKIGLQTGMDIEIHPCPGCSERFLNEDDCEGHQRIHELVCVQHHTLTYRLQVPSDVIPGSLTAQLCLADAREKLRKLHPGVPFDFIPSVYAECGGRSNIVQILALKR